MFPIIVKQIKYVRLVSLPAPKRPRTYLISYETLLPHHYSFKYLPLYTPWPKLNLTLIANYLALRIYCHNDSTANRE